MTTETVAKKRGRKGDPAKAAERAAAQAKRDAKKNARSAELDKFAALGGPFEKKVNAIRASEAADAAAQKQLKANAKVRAKMVRNLAKVAADFLSA